uniref:Sema domain-containing protein n=1 Tax=Octopus bimaculoides TaxID=37653 RepID=A0A0L8GPW0_OCTBM
MAVKHTGSDKYRLLTLKLEFPLSLITYQTGNKYQCITLSDNLLVCGTLRDNHTLYVVDIDEIHSMANVIKQIDIPEILTRHRQDKKHVINKIYNIKVTANDTIIVNNITFIIFFNYNGECLHSVRHYMWYESQNCNWMAIDDNYLYLQDHWEYHNIVNIIIQ